MKLTQAAVLGIAPSLKVYIENDFRFVATFGVNDIFARCPVDFLVCVDDPTRFSPERLDTIYDSDPIKFFSHLDTWTNHERFERIAINPHRHKAVFDGDLIPSSNNSTFVAAALAVKYGFDEVYLFGVDFHGHHFFKDRNASVIAAVNAFDQLNKLTKTKLFVANSDSILADVLPVRLPSR